MRYRHLFRHLFLVVLSTGLTAFAADAVPRTDNPDIEIRNVLNLSRNTVRIGKDPRDNTLYTITQGGTINRIDTEAGSSTPVFSAGDHGVSGVAGFTIGPDGSFYLTSNRSGGASLLISTVTKGQRDPGSDTVEWFVLATTEAFEQCDCIFNHQVNGIAIDAANEYAYVNSGSRTDHGEIQDSGGRFPDLRETGLTSAILRIPTNSRDLILANDRQSLRDQGLLYAEGVRNSFDLAFAANGDLFATENSADRDMAEELNWIRQGHHFGFPWRMGNADNPQQFAAYDPSTDLLLPSSFNAVRNGYYRNDPNFPAPPAALSDPVINLGPDADSYRDPVDGQLKDASDEGVEFGTFTAHRSPLGLVFDTDHAMGGPFTGDGFVSSWTQGDPNGDSVAGPFLDPSEDLLHLELEKTADGTNYQARVTRIVEDFSNPIDAAIIGNRIYVIEWGGGRGLWEITLPSAPTAVVELATATTPDAPGLGQNYPNPFNPTTNIDFDLATSGTVELAIYDLNGQKVRQLVKGHYSAGTYRADWDGKDANGHAVASGVYLYSLKTGNHHQTRRLTLLK